MVELLQRATIMPVRQIIDCMRVESGHVYVISSNRDLSILHGVLHLFEPFSLRDLHLQIDFNKLILICYVNDARIRLSYMC